MPHIVVHLSGQPDADLTRQTVDAVAELTQSVLGKQLPVIAITVQYIDAEAWFIGGQSLARRLRLAGPPKNDGRRLSRRARRRGGNRARHRLGHRAPAGQPSG